MKKLVKIVFKVIIIFSIALFLIEACYRYQLIDFYKSEWNYHNKSQFKEAKSCKVKDQSILVLGDSFSSDVNSWVNVLRKNTDKRIFNASIPGIGPETFRLLLKDRMDDVEPSHIIVQLYVGNDLYDIGKPTNWSKYSLSRNLFYSFSNQFRCLNFLNYKLGQASVEDHSLVESKKEPHFNSNSYSLRTKLYIEGNNNYPQNVILVDSSMQTRFNNLELILLEMKKQCENIKFTVLIIPHCTQTNSIYVERYRELGSLISKDLLTFQKWKERLDKLGMTVIDATKTLQEQEKKGIRMYFENDEHLNDIGQMHLSSFVFKAMKL